MKWTNPGHQLDEKGRKFSHVKNLYIWDAGNAGKKCLEFIRWLKIDADFNIRFVDSDKEKQHAEFCGIPVISPDELSDPETSVVVIAISGDSYKEVTLVLERGGFSCYFFWNHAHNSKRNFVQHFLCVYLMYKHGKLLSHWTDMLVTLRCNLNCKGCLNFNEHIENPIDYSLEEYKAHIDTVFSKFDYLYSAHYAGGEPFINKQFPMFLRYMNENYRARYFDMFVITNGTIVPGDELISALKESGCWVFIDDYRDTVPLSVKTLPLLEQTLTENGIRFVTGKAKFWYDVGLQETDYSDLSEEEMIHHRDSCHTFLQGFKDGKIFSCCYTEYASTAGLIDYNQNDYIDIAAASKMELLEFRQGYTKTGYVELCRRCKGIGKDAVTIPAAVQIPKRGV